jgi:hypothetical protein
MSSTLTSLSESVSPGFAMDFDRVAQELRKDPYRVGLLPLGMGAAFVTQPTPFAKEFWIVRDSGGKALGRIGASVSAIDKSTGAIGFFEVAVDHPQVAKQLLQAAEAWLKSKGVLVAHGPVNFNTWFSYRFRTGQQDDLRFSWEPVNPSEYVTFWMQNGYTELEVYKSQGHDGLKQFAEVTRPAYEKALKLGCTFRPFDSKKVMEVEVPVLYDISMDGFRDNFLFEPIPFEAFQALYVPVAGKLDLGLAHMAMDVRGQPVGFFFCYQDNEYLVYKSVAVKHAGRGMGVSNALAYLAAQEGLKRGLSRLITALVKSGAQSESYGKKAALLWEHGYGLYKKALV